MKRKIILIILLSIILYVISVIPVFASNSSVVGVPEYIADWGGEEYFFANGTAVTVEARTDGEAGAIVKWKENGIEKSQVMGTVSNIFGGMHDNATPVETSITINGGFVAWIHGGGLHKSYTTKTNIVMNGGQVGMIKGGGADQWVHPQADCGCTGTDRKWIDGDYENSPSQTIEANIIIKGGKIEKYNGNRGSVFGGGNGYANTKSANISILGGDLSNAIISGGGSNGNTDEASINISDGTVGVVQSINRGTMKSIEVSIIGGTIEKLYVAGEEADDVDGTITGNVNLDVTGNAKVEKMSLGKNAGTIVDSSTDNAVKAENIKVASGTVKELNGDMNKDVTLVYEVTIDDKVYLLEPGKTIKDIPEYDNIIKKDGYEFIGFKWNENNWDIDKEVTETIKLTSEFKKIEINVEEDKKDEVKEEQTETETEIEVEKEEANVIEEVDNKKDDTPKTGFEETQSMTFLMIAILFIGSIVFVKKLKR